MSDPNYNRKQGVQKYWAMFQRERRKMEENKLKARATQIPSWDMNSSFYHQLVFYMTEYKDAAGNNVYYPACAVFSEMYAFLESCFFKSDVIRYLSDENTGRFRDNRGQPIPGLTVEDMQKFKAKTKRSQLKRIFVLGDLGWYVNMIIASSNVNYMDKVRLRNLFPPTLSKNVFEQWGVADKYPKVLCETTGGVNDSDWCKYEIFKSYYDAQLTLTEYVDTVCKEECEQVHIAESIQSAAFKNYFGIKRRYAEITAKIRAAVQERTADGVDEFKSMKNWADEFGFGIDASFELLYDVISTDEENYSKACEPGKACLSTERVQVKLKTAINPSNVSLRELNDFVSINLRNSIEGVAARTLASADEVAKIRRSLADLTKEVFALARGEFVTFINTWKINFCSDSLIQQLPPPLPVDTLIGDIQNTIRIKSTENATNPEWPDNKLTNVADTTIDWDKASKERDAVSEEKEEKAQDPLRRKWQLHRQKLVEIRRQQEEAERIERRERERAEKEEMQNRLAELLVEKLTEYGDNRLPPPRLVELEPLQTLLPVEPLLPPPDDYTSSSDDDDDDDYEGRDDQSVGTLGSLTAKLDELEIKTEARSRMLKTLTDEKLKKQWDDRDFVAIGMVDPNKKSACSRRMDERIAEMIAPQVGAEHVISDDEDALSDHGF
tara:strand:+ start:6440 stop:8440 length:2001 start_codon:yes stop_codon:yes gene_type:complete